MEDTAYQLHLRERKITMSDMEISKIIELAASAGAKAALMAQEEKRKLDLEEWQDKKLRNTKLLLKNFRKLNLHINNAKFKKSQIDKTDADEYLFELMMYDPRNQRDAIVESIRQSVAKTEVIVSHILKMLKIYEIYCYQDGTDKYMRRYDALYGKYISPKEIKYDEIAEKYYVDIRTIQSDINEAIKEFSSLLFGFDALKNM